MSHASSSALARRTLLALLLCAPLLAQVQAPSADAEPRSIVLITVEALRRDHLSGEGYLRATTPMLDAFARESLVLTRAYTTESAALPAHLSLMTGLDVAQHGLAAAGWMRAPFAWSAGRRSAATCMQDAKLHSGAIVSSAALGKLSGLDSGFQFLDEPESGVRAASDVAERASKWLDVHGKGRFFLWLAFDGGCEPNAPPAEFAARFHADEQLDLLLDARGIEPERFKLGFSPLLQIRMFFPELEGKVTPVQGMRLPEIDRAAFRSLYDRYDADLCATDAAIGRVLVALGERGLRERTVVAVVGVYGQALGERVQLGHGEVSREQVHVPVLIRAPGLAPARSDALASLVDVMPTVLRLARDPAAEALMAQGSGRDLLAQGFERDGALVCRATRERERNSPGPMWALYTRDFKYVYRPELSDQLYDLATDPDERTNVLAAQPELAAELKKDLLVRIGAAK